MKDLVIVFMCILLLPSCSTDVSSMNRDSLKSIDNSQVKTPVSEGSNLTIVKDKPKYKFKVETQQGATINILNIKPKYEHDIMLQSGRYRIVVEKPGYERYDKWIEIDNNEKSLNVELVRSFIAPDINGNLTWEAGNDFAAGYFDVFFENGFFFAIPSIYSNNLEDILVKDYQNLENCQRYQPQEINDFITVKRYEIADSSKRKVARLYRNDEVVGRLNEVKIDGKGGWRIPSLAELEESSIVSNWQKMLCYDVSIGVKYFSNSFPRYHGKGLITYTKERSSWPVINRAISVWDTNVRHIKGRWENNTNTSNSSAIVLVREPTEVEKLVFMNNENYLSKILKYAELKTNAELTPKRLHVSKPMIAKNPSMPNLKKDEFETTVDFEKRIAIADEVWQKEVKETEKKNSLLMKEYDQELNDAELAYKNIIEIFSDSNYKSNIYRKALEEAIRIVLGKPYFKDFKYDADSQTMSAVVFSARSTEFKKEVQFSVPLSNARTFKSELQRNNLIPLVELDTTMNIVKVNAVTNENKTEMDYTMVKHQNNIEAYSDFINKYPDSMQAKKANSEIAKLKEQARKSELARKIAEKERRNRLAAEREALKQLYLSNKKIGDQVCKPASVAFGFIGIEIKAYVERVDGDRIQLRISSTDDQTIYYNGVPLMNGVLIWDQFYEWKRCN